MNIPNTEQFFVVQRPTKCSNLELNFLDRFPWLWLGVAVIATCGLRRKLRSPQSKYKNRWRNKSLNWRIRNCIRVTEPLIEENLGERFSVWYYRSPLSDTGFRRTVDREAAAASSSGCAARRLSKLPEATCRGGDVVTRRKFHADRGGRRRRRRRRRDNGRRRREGQSRSRHGCWELFLRTPEREAPAPYCRAPYPPGGQSHSNTCRITFYICEVLERQHYTIRWACSIPKLNVFTIVNVS